MTRFLLLFVFLIISACSGSDGGSVSGSGELPDDEVINAIGQYLEENPQQAQVVADALEEYLSGDPDELQAVVDIVAQYLNESDVNLAEVADAAGDYLDDNQLR